MMVLREIDRLSRGRVGTSNYPSRDYLLQARAEAQASAFSFDLGESQSTIRRPARARPIHVREMRAGGYQAPVSGGQPPAALLNAGPCRAGPPGDRDGRIAQLVEQLTLNQRVQGSSPCAPTIELIEMTLVFDRISFFV